MPIIHGPTGSPGSGSSQTTLRADGVVHTVMMGLIDAAAIDRMYEDLVPKLLGSPPIWYVSTLGVTDIDLSLMEPARRLLGAVRGRGYRNVVAAIASNPVGMVGATLCLAAGLRLRPCKTEVEAEGVISKLLADVKS